MLLRLGRTAELGMGERNEIVNEINRTNACAGDPLGVTRAVKASMADIEIEAAFKTANASSAEHHRQETAQRQSP